LGINIRKGIAGMIYKKALKFNQKSIAKASSGKVVTIISGELQNIERGMAQIPYLFITPINTILAFTLIGINFKEGAAIGFGIFILLIIGQFIMSRKLMKWRYMESRFSDKRIELLTDAINGIRTLKVYGWEKPFQNLISKVRKSQQKIILRTLFMISLGAGAIFLNGGYVIAVAIFGYHYLRGREFDYSSTLSTLAILAYLSVSSIFILFVGLANLAQLFSILKRAGEIMNMEEHKESEPDKNTTFSRDTRVKIENGSFTWGFQIKKEKEDKKEKVEIDEQHKDINLSEINLEARDGELIAIIGTVGCGKSTMLAAIMNELEKLSGSIYTSGRKAYVGQEPFIVSGTVRENVLMGSRYDEKLFNEAINV
jgi:ATP-binding cassette subfamily C (CFTR/MRP) protein 1